METPTSSVEEAPATPEPSEAPTVDPNTYVDPTPDILEHVVYQSGGRTGEEVNMYYIYSDLDESCHEACIRYGDTHDLGDLYCNNDAMFNIDIKTTMSGLNVLPENGGPYDRCVEANGPQFDANGNENPDYVTKTFTKTKSSWGPFARFNNYKCFHVTTRGKHKCHFKTEKNWRLCGCAAYADMNEGVPYADNEFITGGATQADGTGWHTVSDVNCNKFCREAQYCDGEWKVGECTGDEPMMAMTCNGDALTSIAGAYNMIALETLFREEMGATWSCGSYDDRFTRTNHPNYRANDQNCWISPLGSNQSAGCHLKANSPGFKFCYCN